MVREPSIALEPRATPPRRGALWFLLSALWLLGAFALWQGFEGKGARLADDAGHARHEDPAAAWPGRRLADGADVFLGRAPLRVLPGQTPSPQAAPSESADSDDQALAGAAPSPAAAKTPPREPLMRQLRRQLLVDALNERATVDLRELKDRTPDVRRYLVRSPRFPGAPLSWAQDAAGEWLPVYSEAERAFLEDQAATVLERRGSIEGQVRFDRLTPSEFRAWGRVRDVHKPDRILEIETLLNGVTQGLCSNAPSAGGAFELRFPLATEAPDLELRALVRDERGLLVELRGSPYAPAASSPSGLERPERFARFQAADTDAWWLVARMNRDGDDARTPRIDVFAASRSVFSGAARRFEALEAVERDALRVVFADYELRDSWVLAWEDRQRRGISATNPLTVTIIEDPAGLSRRLAEFSLADQRKTEPDSDPAARGELSFADGRAISGWGYLPAFGHRAVWVELVIDGVAIERRLADQPFPALRQEEGVSGVNHLFVFETPARFHDGAAHTVQVFLVSEEGDADFRPMELARSPRRVLFQAHSLPIGYLDFVSVTTIEGWAYDADRGDQAVSVELWIDQRFVATVQASAPRADLVPAVAGNPRHGFRLATPEFLKDGDYHVVRAFARDFPSQIPIELKGSPYTIAALEARTGIEWMTWNERGAVIGAVDADAYEAGLRAGDTIVAINGEAMANTFDEYERLIDSRLPGEVITLTVERFSWCEPPRSDELPELARRALEHWRTDGDRFVPSPEEFLAQATKDRSAPPGGEDPLRPWVVDWAETADALGLAPTDALRAQSFAAEAPQWLRLADGRRGRVLRCRDAQAWTFDRQSWQRPVLRDIRLPLRPQKGA